MNHIEAIDKSLKEKLSHQEIVRKVYLTYPTAVLIGEEERQYLIFNEISEYFRIPINHVQVCGSSKTGRSFHKTSTFTPKISDLDIAIIDAELFLYYHEISFKITNGFSDLSKFGLPGEKNSFSSYSNSISKGIFRPDYMPSCPAKSDWYKFFNNVSKSHQDYFKSINAGIYQSQVFFEYKQISNIEKYLASKPI